MKQITRILVSISILLFLFQIDGAFAATETKSTVTDAAIEILNLIVGVLNFIITPFIAFAGWLLSPDWTMGDIFGFRVVLHDMWVTISNITYFIYAIALIIMALASMFNVENYGVKKLLPRFALGIIMVPMTWWFVQATVSLANILTVSVIQIPFETLEKKGGNGDSWLKSQTIPTKFEYFESGSILKVSETKTSLEEIMKKPSAGPFSMLNAFAYNIFSIQDIKTISDEEKSQIKAGVNIFNKLLYGLLVYIAFGFVIIALIAALFKRAILLWVYAMFSPLFSLVFFLPDGLKKGLDLFDYKKFIGLAFVPVFVAGALAFGLVLLNLIVNPIVQSDNCSGANYCLNNIMGDPSSSLKVETSEESVKSTWVVAGITIEHTGKINTASKKAATGAQQLTTSIFGKILFDILGILILWMAVFGALKGSELTAKVVGSVEALGKQAGGMWKYAPIPGIPGGSIHGAEKGIKGAMALPEQRANARFNDSNFGKSLASASGSPEQAKVIDGLKYNAKQITEQMKMSDDKIIESQRYAAQLNAAGIRSGMESIKTLAEGIGKNNQIKEAMSKNTEYGNTQKVQEVAEKIKSGKASEDEIKKFMATFATADRGPNPSFDRDKYKNMYNQYGSEGIPNTVNGSNNQQPAAPSGPQAKYDQKQNVLTLNNEVIVLGKLNNEADAERLKRIASDVSKQYTGELKDLEKLLKDLKIPDSEAEKISNEVKVLRNNSSKK